MEPLIAVDDQDGEHPIGEPGQLENLVGGLGSTTRFLILQEQTPERSCPLDFAQTAVSPAEWQGDSGRAFVVEYRNLTGHYQTFVSDRDGVLALLSAWVSNRDAVPSLAVWKTLKL
jgi:hypothetical protein